jgi:hypothetical protein
MSQSKSHLLNYISLLMHCNQSLNEFLADPVVAGEKNQITKAERAVLRRTVAHLSNNSTNGYSITRHLGSHRRSLRLLQNVLHNTGSKLVQESAAPVNNPTSEGSELRPYPFSIQFYLPSITFSGTDNYFTNKNNEYVDTYRGPYAAFTPPYTVGLPTPTASIKMVMDALPTTMTIPSSYHYGGYSFVFSGGKKYVDSISFYPNGSPNEITKIIADLRGYSLKDDYVFWFYSVNGTPNIENAGGVSGDAGQSFTDYIVSAGDTVYWQLIAPDGRYGFQPCPKHPLSA